MRRVLARIAADLDTLAQQGPEMATQRAEQAADALVRPRQRRAEPEEQPQRGRIAKAQREALRKACGLPHSAGDDADAFRQLRETST